LNKWPKWNPSIKKQKEHENLVLTPRVTSEVTSYKLLASSTYPLKIIKGQSTPYPTTHHNLLLINIRHCVGVSGCCGCGWRLELVHLELLLKSGDRRCPLLKLKVLLLDGILEVYNHVGAGVHLLTGEV
jgi:hypothetical protein